MARRLVPPSARPFGSPSRPLRLLAVVPLLALLVAGAVVSSPEPASARAVAVRLTGRLTFSGINAQQGTVVQAITARTIRDFTRCGSGRVGAGGSYSIDVPAVPDCGYQARTGCCNTYILIAQRQNVGVCYYTADLDRPAELGRTHSCNLYGTQLPYLPPPAADSPTGFPLHAVIFYGRYTEGGLGQRNQDLSVNMDRPGDRIPLPFCAETTTDRFGNYAVGVPATTKCGYRESTDCCSAYVFFVRDERRGISYNVGTCYHTANLDRPEQLGRTHSCNLYG